ncbi:unnamed protein product [Soboliphyme baturini]|uniref:Uncharacterized protein n=1 Tax=Soboliphyme baturini TaxID=241478 RepID=A0A183IUA1_9BILA|nr:unnamed protein product [Soboliphyme baturini]
MRTLAWFSPVMKFQSHVAPAPRIDSILGHTTTSHHLVVRPGRDEGRSAVARSTNVGRSCRPVAEEEGLRLSAAAECLTTSNGRLSGFGIYLAAHKPAFNSSGVFDHIRVGSSFGRAAI